MKNKLIIFLLAISTVAGFTLAYSQYSRASRLEIELQLQRELSEKYKESATKAKIAVTHARISEQAALAAMERAKKANRK